MRGGEGGLGTSCTPCELCDCGQTPVLCSSDVPSENRTNSKMGTSRTQALAHSSLSQMFPEWGLAVP